MSPRPQARRSEESILQEAPLAIQLVSESTLNPLQCGRLLVRQFAAQPATTKHISDGQLLRLPAADDHPTAGHPTPPRRPRRLARAKESLESSAGPWTPLAGDESQVRQFGCKHTRKRLLKQLGLARVLRRASRQACSAERLHSRAGYEIDRLLSAANQHLERSLRAFASADFRKLRHIIERPSLDTDGAGECAFERPDWRQRIALPTGIRLADARVDGGKRRSSGLSELASSSHDSGLLSIASKPSFGSASTDSIASSSRGEFRSLERLIGFRSGFRFQKIVNYSCDLFHRVLLANPLLCVGLLERTFESDSSLQQLKLFACVECHKLRAMMRFNWLLKCQCFAFENKATCQTDHQELDSNPPYSRLPSVLGTGRYLDEGAARAYSGALNRLLGRLLRDHFLEPALESWLNLIAQRLHTPGNRIRTEHRPMLNVPVELVEEGNGQLAAKDPSDAIKRALEFVLDELASISSNLPKLLEGEHTSFIEVLPKGDDLLSEKRAKLTQLLNGARAQQTGETGWIASGYSQIISIVNQLRAKGTLEQFGASSIRDEDDGWHQATSNSSREAELRSTCRQVKSLENFDMLLKSRFERFFNFGQLISLDCKQLNEQLIKIVEQERSLLIRLHSDDICKLMESLRVQLDDLELNLDLEWALEDYLNKRRQLKQSQQPDLNQQILLDGNMDADFEMDEADLFHASQQRELAESVALSLEAGAEVAKQSGATVALAQLRSGSRSSMHEDEEELANAMVSNSNLNVAHLFAMSNPNGVPLGEMLASGELGVGSRGLAPLVECRLLLGRYEYLDQFIERELEQFLQNVVFVAKFGLMFLTEFLPTLPSTRFQEQHLETNQLELIGELGVRTREFTLMLRDAFDRLEASRQTLNNSNRLRSSVMNRVCLEFDWLMQQLSWRRLNALRGTSDDSRNNIKHLDLIQETSTWAQKLESRLEFLSTQNGLLQQEAQILHICEQYRFEPFEQLDRLAANKLARDLKLPPDRCSEFDIRAQVLEQWGEFARVASLFWLLVEEFETQQVKWLNSDSKKLDYEKVRGAFEENYSKRLSALISQLQALTRREINQFMGDKYSTLLENMVDLESSFSEFSQKFLPIFKFLTNRHLTQEHWIKLSQLINTLSSGAKVSSSELQLCTTVAQLLELNVQEFVGQLDAMSHQASIEHELSSLILSETTRMDEQARHSGSSSTKMQLESLEICSRLDEWNEEELILASSRFIRFKLDSESQSRLIDSAVRNVQIDRLARQLVTCHTSIRRFLGLSGHLNLITCSIKSPVGRRNQPCREAPGSGNLVVLRTNTLLNTTQQVRASLLLEYLRLFTQTWLESSSRMSAKLTRLQTRLEQTQDHLTDIEQLLADVRGLTRTELKVASRESEQQLSQLQQDCMKLEFEREILSTREALALEKQREALKARDICVRQVSERVIPAVRAATRALDCLGDGRSLRALRSYRAKPPFAIRLVIEAVCLLRNACCSAESRHHLTLPQAAATSSTHVSRDESAPIGASLVSSNRTAPTLDYPTTFQRRFDSLRGQIVEDYWPIACRTLNGLHSSRFIADLRQVSKRTIPRHIIRLIRRKYLSRAEFHVENIERISQETGLLARWLIAVDVFDRVINIVKPNYEQYLNAERSLSELLEDVAHKRQQINFISQRLEQMNEHIRKQIGRRAGLADLVDDCSQRSRQLERTKLELERKRDELVDTSEQLQRRMQRLARGCLWRTARLVYLDALARDERRPIERILRALITQLEFN